MEIKYYPNNLECISIFFREWLDGKKYYYSTNGLKLFVGEMEEIPTECEFILPHNITGGAFEDAVLELAKQIRENRHESVGDEEVGRDYPDLTFTPKQSTEDRLIAIIDKLVDR